MLSAPCQADASFSGAAPAPASQLTKVLVGLRHTFVVADATLPDQPLIYASEGCAKAAILALSSGGLSVAVVLPIMKLAVPDVRRRFLQMTGYSAEEVLGANWCGLACWQGEHGYHRML